MIKKTITYTNVDGNKETYEAWFNLSKNDIIKMISDGWDDKIQALAKSAKDEWTPKKILEFLKYITALSYGKRVADADGTHVRFIKKESNSEEFIDSDVYGEFAYNMMVNPEEFATFIKALVPADIKNSDEYKKYVAEHADELQVSNLVTGDAPIDESVVTPVINTTEEAPEVAVPVNNLPDVVYDKDGNPIRINKQ